MSNILIINGAKQFAHSNGELNDTLTDFSESHLKALGHTVQVTRTDSDYDIQAEIEKYLWADVVIYQMPGWWMGAPWTMKKYIDDILRLVMAHSMPVMDVAVLMHRKNMVQVACSKIKNTCCR